MSPPVIEVWYHDRTARRFLLLGYVPWIAALSLAWEIAHLPLYTIWSEASWMFMAFAVAHCTAGDVLIGTACLALHSWPPTRDHMPVIEVAAVRLGASPLLQWVVIPPLALYAARRRADAEMRAILRGAPTPSLPEE